MSKTLHVFCSKEALTIFNNSTIEGDTLLFNEKLTEGPLVKDVFSDSFWSKRYSFFENTYEVSKVNYFDTTIKPILQLEDVSAYTEVVLWLDYTKFSQVNLIALGSFLAQNFSKNVQYFLVCSGKHKGKTELQELTNYTSSEFPILYNYKVKITLPNLEYLHTCWEAFATNDTHFKYDEFANKFRYLQNAITN